MGDYLPVKAADYTTEMLDVTPQVEMTQSNIKVQESIEADDGSITVISYSDNIYFDISVSWEYVTLVEAEIITSLWISPLKGNGSARTFYWLHPSDGYIYVVRYLTQPVLKQMGSISTFRGIGETTLRIEGIKA